MNKIKLLLDVVEDMRSLADSLQALADAMTQGDAPEAEPVQKTAPPPPRNRRSRWSRFGRCWLRRAMMGKPMRCGNCCRNTALQSCRRWILSTTRLC